MCSSDLGSHKDESSEPDEEENRDESSGKNDEEEQKYDEKGNHQSTPDIQGKSHDSHESSFMLIIFYNHYLVISQEHIHKGEQRIKAVWQIIKTKSRFEGLKDRFIIKTKDR